MTKWPTDRHTWTNEEVRLLIELREDEAWDWQRIGEKLGINPMRCAARYSDYRNRHCAERHIRPASQSIPNAVAIDREKREAARDRMSVTGQLFGDPPPGYSELDKRGARAS